MRLHLKNFRCYTDKTFDFGTEGLVLVSGPSGSGKSTLMIAIMFVLYDQGTKVVQQGKTSCQVSFEDQHFKIVRTKRPNRVVLTNLATSETYEDDAAQAIINEKYGKAFETTSYIRQNAIDSFITMKPTDKLEFLEKFAFTGIDLVQIKNKCQNKIREAHNDLTKFSGQLEIIQEDFQQKRKPDKVQFPLALSKGGKEKTMKNEETRFNNAKIKVKQAERQYDKYRNDLTELRVFLAQYTVKKENLANLEKKIATLDSELNGILFQGDESLKLLEDDLQALISQRELTLLKERYSQDKTRLELMQTTEMEELSDKIKLIQNNLWKEYTRTELDQLLSQREDMKRDSEQIEKWQKILQNSVGISESKLTDQQKKLEQYRRELELKKDLLSKLILQKEIYDCPACHTSLRFQDDQLVIEDNFEDISDDIPNVEKEIGLLQKSIQKLESSIPTDAEKLKRYKEATSEIERIQNRYDVELLTVDEAQDDIDSLKEYRRAQTEQENQIKSLQKAIDDKKYSTNVLNFKSTLSKTKEQIKTLEAKMKGKIVEENEEYLRTTIQTQRQAKQLKEHSQKQLKNYQAELNQLKSEISILQEREKEMNNLNLVELELKVKNCQVELEQYRSDVVKHQQNVEKIQIYRRYETELNEYRQAETRFLDIQESEKKARDQYHAALMLRDKILEAESIAIANIIDSINFHAHEYLELFFPDNPITIHLQSFKQSKKSNTAVKPQINLEINYKGMDAELNMLSGGELARVVLAFCLSLAEIFNTPFLLLDECTASLDQDLNSTVLEGIRKNFNQKLVIVIAHQVVSGDFDRQIVL